MKKVLSIVLAIAMIATMSAVAFAKDYTDPTFPVTESIDVKGTYSNENIVITNKYKVTLTWNEVAFTFTDGTTKTWNPETHVWDIVDGGSWAANEGKDTVTIEATNHSSLPVTVSVAFADKAGDVPVASVEYTDNVDDLALTEWEGETNTGKVEATVTVDGQLPETEGEVVLGTFTVTIDDVDAAQD